ncbi:MAG: DUF4157 domain-containing protein, partial [Candidatus Zixiibacteriota bacterium]
MSIISNSYVLSQWRWSNQTASTKRAKGRFSATIRNCSCCITENELMTTILYRSTMTGSISYPAFRFPTQVPEPERRPDSTHQIVHDALRPSGRPLDPSTRSFMEARFGHDFSRVRVHADGQAAAAARAVNARAYTLGQDVVFAGGQYAPDTLAGQRLLAHELTH